MSVGVVFIKENIKNVTKQCMKQMKGRRTIFLQILINNLPNILLYISETILNLIKVLPGIISKCQKTTFHQYGSISMQKFCS